MAHHTVPHLTHTGRDPLAICRAIASRKQRDGYPIVNQDHFDELVAELALEYVKRARRWDGRGNQLSYICHYLHREYPRLWAKTHPELRVTVRNNRRTITTDPATLPLKDTLPASDHPLLAA